MTAIQSVAQGAVIQVNVSARLQSLENAVIGVGLVTIIWTKTTLKDALSVSAMATQPPAAVLEFTVSTRSLLLSIEMSMAGRLSTETERRHHFSGLNATMIYLVQPGDLTLSIL